jgi:uncharacterized protein YpmS
MRSKRPIDYNFEQFNVDNSNQHKQNMHDSGNWAFFILIALVIMAMFFIALCYLFSSTSPKVNISDNFSNVNKKTKTTNYNV